MYFLILRPPPSVRQRSYTIFSIGVLAFCGHWGPTTMDAEIEEMVKVADSCALCRCGCCKDDCPMYSEILEETMSPKGRNFMIRAVARGLIEPDERTVRIAYSCLLCRRDEITCVAKLRNAEATEAFRRYLVDRGVPLLPEHELLAKSLENYGNPWQESKVARKRWAKDFADK